jgi:hypothetical protein
MSLQDLASLASVTASVLTIVSLGASWLRARHRRVRAVPVRSFRAERPGRCGLRFSAVGGARLEAMSDKRKLPEDRALRNTRAVASNALKGTDYESFARDLVTESDRGAALIGGAWLEDALAFVFRAVAADEKIIEEMLGIHGSIGTFSSRIDAALVFGLITRREQRNLTLVRKIRNRAAHLRDPKGGEPQWTEKGFDEPVIAEWCSKFEIHPWIEDNVKGQRPRVAFLFVVGFHVAALRARVNQVPRIVVRSHEEPQK